MYAESPTLGCTPLPALGGHHQFSATRRPDRRAHPRRRSASARPGPAPRHRPVAERGAHRRAHGVADLRGSALPPDRPPLLVGRSPAARHGPRRRGDAGDLADPGDLLLRLRPRRRGGVGRRPERLLRPHRRRAPHPVCGPRRGGIAGPGSGRHRTAPVHEPPRFPRGRDRHAGPRGRTRRRAIRPVLQRGKRTRRPCLGPSPRRGPARPDGGTPDGLRRRHASRNRDGCCLASQHRCARAPAGRPTLPCPRRRRPAGNHRPAGQGRDDRRATLRFGRASQPAGPIAVVRLAHLQPDRALGRGRRVRRRPRGIRIGLSLPGGTGADRRHRRRPASRAQRPNQQNESGESVWRTSSDWA